VGYVVRRGLGRPGGLGRARLHGPKLKRNRRGFQILAADLNGFKRILNPNQYLNLLTNKNLNFGSKIKIRDF
jgi:hypothetical protein